MNGTSAWRPKRIVAVVLAALSSFLIGGLWYSPLLFSTVWQAAVGLTDAQLQSANLGATFGGAFVSALIAATALSILIGSGPTAFAGLSRGLLVGVGFAATSIVTVFLFEQRPATLMLIDAGYQVVSFATMGAIFGALSRAPIASATGPLIDHQDGQGDLSAEGARRLESNLG
jgi:hypothetical protein